VRRGYGKGQGASSPGLWTFFSFTARFPLFRHRLFSSGGGIPGRDRPHPAPPGEGHEEDPLPSAYEACRREPRPPGAVGAWPLRQGWGSSRSARGNPAGKSSPPTSARTPRGSARRERSAAALSGETPEGALGAETLLVGVYFWADRRLNREKPPTATRLRPTKGAAGEEENYLKSVWGTQWGFCKTQ